MSRKSTVLAPLFLGLGLLGFLAPPALAADAGCRLLELAELPVTMNGLKPTTHLKVNGQDATFVTDSGAFFSTMLPSAAERLKLHLVPAPFGMTLRGIGGAEEHLQIGTAKTFTLGRAELHDIQFLVSGQSFGANADALLGQNVLSVFDTEYDLGHGMIRLFQPQACSKAIPTYWDQGGKFSAFDVRPITREEPHISSQVRIDGVAMRAIFDSGSSRSILTLKAARRLGFRPDAPGVVSGGTVSGLGPHAAQTWIAVFDSFEAGDGEQITKAKLRVADIEIGEGDMLLGADYFLSHRIYLSKTQRRLYATYNGGPVFDLERGPALAFSAPPSPTADAAPAGASEPTTADAYARRAAASAARHDYLGAMADYSKAITLEPNDAQHYVDRARVHISAHEPTSALADLDAALKIRPDDAQALSSRGVMYLANHNTAAAETDFKAALASPNASPNLALNIAGAYTAAGLYPQAIAGYDSWIAAHPASPELAIALNGRCWTRAVAGRELETALADCNAAIRQGPRGPGMFDSRALVELRLGQVDKAMDDYDTALKLQPNLAWAHYGRGLAERRKGLTVQANADIAQAMTLNANLPRLAKRYGLDDGAGPAAPASAPGPSTPAQPPPAQ
jgi:tetratricopeptide (TPR) repeat protein/predicted aspartyl protease